MRLFRNVAGMTIHEYLTQHRLAHAQQMLVAADAKVADIARACGISSTTRFYEAFEKYVGVTPGEYRRKSRA